MVKKKNILGDRTTVQIKKETLKKLLQFKTKSYHPRATYDEMFNDLLKKDIKKVQKGGIF